MSKITRKGVPFLNKIKEALPEYEKVVQKKNRAAPLKKIVSINLTSNFQSK